MASHREEQINTAKKKMCTCQKQVSCLFTTAADKDFEPGITQELLVKSSNFPANLNSRPWHFRSTAQKPPNHIVDHPIVWVIYFHTCTLIILFSYFSSND